MANCLQEINDLVAAVQEGQQKIWGAIESISKDLQELIQKDAGADEEDEEAFHTFLFGLQLHLQEHVGAHV